MKDKGFLPEQKNFEFVFFFFTCIYKPIIDGSQLSESKSRRFYWPIRVIKRCLASLFHRTV